MELLPLKHSSFFPDLAIPRPPMSRRGTHEAARAGFWGLKQPTFYIYEMVVPVRRRLHVKESKWTEPTVQVWPHNVFLCKYLEMQAARKGLKYFADKTVLELGAGCGLTGMVAAMLGASVTVVEGAALFPHLSHNVDAFKAEWKGELQIRCEEEGAALGKLWTGGDQSRKPVFDIILCSDITTPKELSYSFLLTLLKLMGAASVGAVLEEVLLCYTRDSSGNRTPAPEDNDNDRFVGRLSEVFEVAEVESEDTIRTFCEQLTGAQLLRSQSTIDIQECSDAEGRLVVLRLRCSQCIEGLKEFVNEQLERETALQRHRESDPFGVHPSPEHVFGTIANDTESASAGRTTADKTPTAGDRPLDDTDSVIRTESHNSASPPSSGPHKRIFPFGHDTRPTDMAVAGRAPSRLLRPQIIAGTKGEVSPSTKSVTSDSRTRIPSALVRACGPSAERSAIAEDLQKTDAANSVSPSSERSPAAQLRRSPAARKVTEQLDTPHTCATQSRAASPPVKNSAEKTRSAWPVPERPRVRPSSVLRVNSSSSTVRTQLASHRSKAPSQGSPSSRTRTLGNSSKDECDTPESTDSLRVKASSTPMAVKVQQQQQHIHSSSRKVAAKAGLLGSSQPPSTGGSPGARSFPSSVAPALKLLRETSRLITRRGNSAAAQAAALSTSTSTATPMTVARPFSLVDAAGSSPTNKTVRGPSARSAQERPATSKTANMGNKSSSSMQAAHPHQSQQRSSETPGVDGARKATSVSNRLSIKFRTAFHSAHRDTKLPERKVTREPSSTSARKDGALLRKRDNI